MKNIIVTVAVAAVVLGTFFLIPRIVKINYIDCQSQFGPCDDTIKKNLELFLGRSLFDSKASVQNYLKELTYVKKFAIHFQLPDKLKIDLIQKKADFGVFFGGDTAVVDKDGFVLAYQSQSLLPRLLVEKPTPSLGGRVDETTLLGLKILAYLNNIFNVREVKVEADSFNFYFQSGQKVIFPLIQDFESKVGALMLINNELNNLSDESRIKGAGVSSCRSDCVIDLRFENPVIKDL